MIDGLPVVRFARFELLVELKRATGQQANRHNRVDGGHISLCRKLLLSSTLMPETARQDQPGRLLRHLLKIDWDLLIRI